MIYSWVESWEVMAFIYVITNDINGKQYVGKTNNSIEERFREHVSDSRKRRCEKRPLYSAMNKYGIEHFSIKILDECSADESADREIYWIKKLHTYGKTGYNATMGGDSKKYYDYKTIANKYLELQNQKDTAEYFNCDVLTVRNACKEYGVQIKDSSTVAKEKFGKKINMLDINTFEILRTFNSIKEAAIFLRDNNISHESNPRLRGTAQKIGDTAKGRLSHAYGYKWSFA